MSALGQLFQAAHGIMDWLCDCAKVSFSLYHTCKIGNVITDRAALDLSGLRYNLSNFYRLLLLRMNRFVGPLL